MKQKIYSKLLFALLVVTVGSYQAVVYSPHQKRSDFKNILQSGNQQKAITFFDTYYPIGYSLSRERRSMAEAFLKKFYPSLKGTSIGSQETLENLIAHLTKKTIVNNSALGLNTLLDTFIAELPVNERPGPNATLQEKQTAVTQALQGYKFQSEHGSSGIPSPVSTPFSSGRSTPTHSEPSSPVLKRPEVADRNTSHSGTTTTRNGAASAPRQDQPPAAMPAAPSGPSSTVPEAPPLPTGSNTNSIPPAPGFAGSTGAFPPPPPPAPNFRPLQAQLKSELQKKIDAYERLKNQYADAQINTIDAKDYQALIILASTLRRSEESLNKSEPLRTFSEEFQNKLDELEKKLKPSDTKKAAQEELEKAKKEITEALKTLREKAKQLETENPGSDPLQAKLTPEDKRLAETIKLTATKDAVKIFYQAQQDKQQEIKKLLNDLKQLIEKRTPRLQNVQISQRTQAISEQLESLSDGTTEEENSDEDDNSSEETMQETIAKKERQNDAIFPTEVKEYNGKENNPFFVSILMNTFRPGTKLELSQTVRAGFLTVETTNRFGIYNDLLGGQKELAKTEDGKLQLWVLGPSVKNPEDFYLLKTMGKRIPRPNAHAIDDDTPKVMVSKEGTIEGSKTLYLFAVEPETFGGSKSKESLKRLYGKLVPKIKEKKQSDTL